ncbi:fumarylacetoacetate hydrolase family protein [Pseudoalteromonas sp. S16_S37]|uniref:fumarylacetoacetate hydrolase family protein n=1 Tax=Pseudoalteromonas sp. S16_S37 TaxID=2720228 RepID=UPI0016808487|nr:fumarylacetoacetate hydrolase family protein [Pseudoalteromonas sp. S16_S37]MBD1584417.1 isomerase/hydrolase [Pseudoalteromonas sp. S16_S37]
MYTHQWASGQKVDLPLGKIVCVGRNYVEHAQELNNLIPSEPLIFMKPSTSYQSFKEEIKLDKSLGEHHYEAELALLIGERLDKHHTSPLEAIVGVGLALDLTLRDMQSELKQQGYPWERAKAYDGSCPITPFVAVNTLAALQNLEFRFWQNNQLMQHGNTDLMIFSFAQLLQSISQFCTLMPGDVILTGTPKGVGKLEDKALLSLQLNDQPKFEAQVKLQ